MIGNINLYLLHASGLLDPLTDLIRAEFTNGMDKILEKLPVSDVDVCIYDSRRGVIPEIGIGGSARNAHLVFIKINPEFPDIEKSVAKRLKRTLAHELHHCMRWRNPGYGKTLLEELVTEGLACHFELEVDGGEPEQYCKALSDEDLTKFMKKAKNKFPSVDFSHGDWFFGSKEKGIPRWTGYSLGFKLVSDYLKMNPDKKASKLYATEAGEFSPIL